MSISYDANSPELETIRGILLPYEADSKPIEIKVGNDLFEIQSAIRGHLTLVGGQTVTFVDGVIGYCDDEGLLKGRPVNNLMQMVNEIVYGPVLILGCDHNNGDEVDLPAQYTVENWTTVFEKREL